MQTFGQGEQLRRIITLTGSPRVDDPAQLTLDARDSIVLALKPRPRPTPPAAGSSAAAPPPATSEAFQVEWMTAQGDVHMVSAAAPAAGDTAADPSRPGTGNRTLTAKERLDVVFEHPAPAAVAPAEPAPTGPAATPAPVGPTAEAAPKPGEPKPAEPAMDVQADSVWARVVLAGQVGPSGRSKGEVREVRMRHAVRLHQDPSPGKARGMDVTADALDLTIPAPGRAQLQAQGTADQPAEASTAEFTIRGPILGMDQGADLAWVQGPGELNQMAQSGLLAGLKPQATAASASRTPDPQPSAPTKGPLVITWQERMEFHGRPPDEHNQPGPARAIFLSDVHATQDDDTVACQEMEAILDRPVAFVRPAQAARSPGQPAEPRPQVVAVICRKQVEIVSRKRDEATRAIREVQRVSGEEVTYDRASSTFWVDGTGTVRSYARETSKRTDASVSRTAVGDRRRPVQGRDPSPASPLLLTRIDFRKGMEGKMGTPLASGQAGPRQAEFRGGVQVLRAAVADFDRDLDRDHPPADFVALDSRVLQIESIPAPAGSKAPARTLLKATDNATARTIDSAIQGDWITYDSANGLFYVYGSEANPVSIASQNGPGLPASSGTAQVVRYNPKTGVSDVHAPGSVPVLPTEDRLPARRRRPSWTRRGTPQAKASRGPPGPQGKHRAQGLHRPLSL